MILSLKDKLDDALQARESYKSLVNRIQVTNEVNQSPYSFGDRESPAPPKVDRQRTAQEAAELLRSDFMKEGSRDNDLFKSL